MTRSIATTFLVAVGSAAAIAQPAEILVNQDYMSSGFFQSDFLRGEETNSGRGVNRATSPIIFGVQGETTYFNFDFDPGSFAGPVTQAVFRVETVANGFFPDPSAGNPADISLHSLSADPLASIDQSLASGPGSWIDFRDNEISTSSIISTTSVDGLGVFDWDITGLVNEWIANGDANFAYTIGSSAILDPETAVGFVNSSWSGLTDEVTARIVIVPAPGAFAMLGSAWLIAGRRRRA